MTFQLEHHWRTWKSHITIISWLLHVRMGCSRPSEFSISVNSSMYYILFAMSYVFTSLLVHLLILSTIFPITPLSLSLLTFHIYAKFYACCWCEWWRVLSIKQNLLTFSSMPLIDDTPFFLKGGRKICQQDGLSSTHICAHFLLTFTQKHPNEHFSPFSPTLKFNLKLSLDVNHQSIEF